MGKLKLVLFWLFAFLSLTIQAQEEATFSLDATVTLVSRNIWRGCYQAGASIQPEAAVSFKSWEFSIWGTAGFNDNEKEIDLSLRYGLNNLSILFTDYWFGKDTASYGRGHIPEIGLEYGFSRIPASISLYLALRRTGGSLPGYADISYHPRWNGWLFDFKAGMTPWRNNMLDTGGWSVTCLSAGVSKPVISSATYAVKAGVDLIYNPDANATFWIASISIAL